jgi:hypothetical protein
MAGFVTFDEVDRGSPSSMGVSVSVVALLIECWCIANLQWVRHQGDHGPALWGGVVRHLRGYLLALWVSGILKGQTAGEAFSVKCDDTTMSPEDVANGMLICRVKVAAVNPSEFVHFLIRIRLIISGHPRDGHLWHTG